MAEPVIFVIEGDAVRDHGGEMLALCSAVFPEFSAPYLLERLPHLDHPALVGARDFSGRLIAFKLGYRRGATLFYSWLGGVHPDARRRGLAALLMEAQHRWAREAGYAHVETRTRATNSAMIILNLKSGFTIAGFEVDKAGFAVVTQRAMLG